MLNKILLSNRLFENFNEADCKSALELLSATKSFYAKNSILVSAGERMDRFGFVVSGGAQVSFSDIDGNMVLVASVSQGETFGEALCWLQTEEIPVSVTASADSEILWLCPDELRKSNASPLACELKNRYLSMLASKTLAMNDRVQILSKPSIRLKLVTFFSQCANRQGTKTFTIPLDRETLALYLGVNRSALSRELSAMEKEGIIEFYKNSFKILK